MRATRRPRGSSVRRVHALAAAKVNVGWRVGPLRRDGFHDVAGLLHTVTIHDRLDVTVHDELPDGPGIVVDVDGTPVRLTVAGPEGSDRLQTPDNLVVRAAALVARRGPARPVSLHLHKEIPEAAGLGGGSADAAAALVALSVAWSVRLSPAALVSMAAEISSDAPAILLGGLVHCSGRGERVRNVGCASQTTFVLGVGEGKLSAGRVYAKLDELRQHREPAPGDVFWHNDLEAAAVALDARVGAGLEAMRAAGPVAAFVSGSGPTVVGIAAAGTNADDLASAVAPAFRRVIVCTACPWGVRLETGAAR